MPAVMGGQTRPVCPLLPEHQDAPVKAGCLSPGTNVGEQGEAQGDQARRELLWQQAEGPVVGFGLLGAQ